VTVRVWPSTVKDAESTQRRPTRAGGGPTRPRTAEQGRPDRGPMKLPVMRRVSLCLAKSCRRSHRGRPMSPNGMAPCSSICFFRDHDEVEWLRKLGEPDDAANLSRTWSPRSGPSVPQPLRDPTAEIIIAGAAALDFRSVQQAHPPRRLPGADAGPSGPPPPPSSRSTCSPSSNADYTGLPFR